MEVQVHEYAWMWQRLGLSLAECRVYAFIYGLTKSKKYNGYEGSKRQLAAMLGLDAGATKRVLDNLQEKQLVIFEDGKWMSVVLNNVSVATNNESVATNNESVVSNNSPHTPLYNNINNNKKAAMRVINFNLFWDLFNPASEFANRKAVCELEWDKCSEPKKQAIINALTNAEPTCTNPYFHIQDFPEPTPTNYNGKPQIDQLLKERKVKSACYNGKWGMYTLEDIQLFNLQTSQ